MIFSSKFDSFVSWYRHANKISNYTKRIIRLHKLAPKLSLNELRVARLSHFDLSKKKWFLLTPSQKSTRILALEIKRRMKEGKSLTFASKEIGLSKIETLRYLGRAVTKKVGRWFPNTRDRIERAMKIYEKGQIKTIIVTNSDDAEYIGEYYNAVKNYLYTGDVSYLKPFKRRAIYDDKGIKHKLETRPDKIREIEEAKEDSEFFEVYTDDF